MVKRIGSARRKTRNIFSSKHSEKGKIKIRNHLREYADGDVVLIAVDPSVNSALPYRRFVGKSGKIFRKQGTCYLVTINDHGKNKQILVHPAHIREYIIV